MHVKRRCTRQVLGALKSVKTVTYFQSSLFCKLDADLEQLVPSAIPILQIHPEQYVLDACPASASGRHLIFSPRLSQKEERSVYDFRPDYHSNDIL